MDMTWDTDENEEEVDDQQFQWAGRDGLIFLIDFTKPMFQKTENDEIPFMKCLECCQTTMLNKIISSNKDVIGIVLFGTSKTSNSLGVQHIYVLQELEQPNAERIKHLIQMLKQSTNDLSTEYGHSTDYSLFDAMWVCQSMFCKSPLKVTSQRIMLFTNTSNPHSNNIHRQNQARKKAEDLGQFGIQLELLYLGENFDGDAFYKDILLLARGSAEDDDDDWQLPDPVTKFEELSQRVCRKDHKKRSVGKVYFSLGEGVRIGVGVYNLVRSTPMPKRILLNRSTNQTVKSSRVHFHPAADKGNKRNSALYNGRELLSGKETGAIVLHTEVTKYQDFGDRKICFKPDEIKKMNQMTDVGFKLLGFKPASRVKLHHHLKPSSFIFPEDQLVKGSCALFAALLERCIAKDVVAVCVFTPRFGSAPKHVVLLPQQEELDESGIQKNAPGFHVVYLPYADNIRDLSVPELKEPPPELVEVAKKIVNKVKTNYSPYMIENPKLQTHWSNIEALALELEEARPVEDHTIPDVECIDKRLDELAQTFVTMTHLDTEVKKTAPKRSNTGASRDPTSAKKPAKGGVDDVVSMAQQGKVEKLTNDVLKTFLRDRGKEHVSSLRKADLVAMVYECLGIKQ